MTSAMTPGRWLRAVLAFLVIAAVYFHRLDQPLLWGDEADTGVEARAILNFGYPTAFDGRNLNLFESGAQLSRRLVCTQIPWIQYYLGALSLRLFGDDTRGLRVLFAAVGLLAFVPIYAVLVPRVRHPALVAALALLAPQSVLFQRNARYYPILVFLFAALVWHLATGFKSLRVRRASAGAIWTLLFFTHPFAALCAAVSTVIFLGPKRSVEHAVAAGGACLFWFAWYEALGPGLGPTPLFLYHIADTPLLVWLKYFLAAIAAAPVDLDTAGWLPLLLVAGIGAALYFRRRGALRQMAGDPVFGFVMICLAVQAVAAGALFGVETTAHYSLLRYMPHLGVLGLVGCLAALDAALSSGAAAMALAFLAVVGNGFTVAWWMHPFGRTPNASWVGPVYSEIFHPRPGAWSSVFHYWDGRPISATDTVLVAFPPGNQAAIIFYLGDRFLVRHVKVGTFGAIDDDAIRTVIGDDAFARLAGDPAWLLDSSGLLKHPAGFSIVATFPSFQSGPYDADRPELTRRSFFQQGEVGSIKIFRRQQ